LGSPNVGIGTIQNDDGAINGVTLGVGDRSMHEGDSGTRVMKFPVTLSRPETSTVTVQYAVVGKPVGGYTASGGTKAGAGVDFQARSGTLTFKLNTTSGLTPMSKTISVTVYGDTGVETDETFGVILSNPSGGGVALGTHSSGLGTIRNDDTG